MPTHVFIVNNDTFPSHLCYLFAGTGASYGDKNKVWVDWNVALLSDIKRVRAGDFVIFYIEAVGKEAGGFYGIFRIADKAPIVFHVPKENGFEPNLGIKLIYRTLLEPFEVYSDGVPEWEALDKLPIYATDVQWSLIYRKLKGKRGCTPLLPWEAQNLMNMIRSQNAGQPIADAQFVGGFDWDIHKRKIITTSSRKEYPGPKDYNHDPLEAISFVRSNRSYERCLKESKNFAISSQYLRRNTSYEGYLQLYFTQNIGIDPILNPIIGNNVVWFGNEVACGVGMQKIDILTVCQEGERKQFRLIELKDEPIEPGVLKQMEYYTRWASQSSGRHLAEASNWNIQPIIVAPPHKLRNWPSVIDALKRYNATDISLPVLYFEFTFNASGTISFQEIRY